MSEFDPFKPGSNLKEDFDGVISDGVFQKGDNSQNWSLLLTVDADDGESVEINLGLGGDWASYDGGQSVEHPRGKEKAFNGQTAYSKWIVAAIDAGAKEVLQERNRQYDNRGPQYAALWKDLRFHFDVVEVTARNRVVSKDSDGSEKVEWVDGVRDAMRPIKYLPTIAGQTSGSPSPSSPSTAPAAPTETSSNANLPGDKGLTPELSAKVKILAKTAADFNKFVDDVLAIDGILGYADVVDALGTQVWFNELKG